ncbi:hypothetical protein LIA77_01260 [Sarocladium implicatum]|nr:hypothetical protein LIA77_01260 [Sarocladium implicatum]
MTMVTFQVCLEDTKLGRGLERMAASWLCCSARRPAVSVEMGRQLKGDSGSNSVISCADHLRLACVRTELAGLGWAGLGWAG